MIDIKKIIESISRKEMDELLVRFSTLDRLSGEPDEKIAIDYITDKLKSYGVNYTVNEFDAYLSDPIKGELEVITPEKFSLKCKTRSFSLNVPDGIEGEVVYVPNVGSIFDDEDGELDVFHGKKQLMAKSPVSGKIIVSEGGSPQHIDKAQKLGAIGLIHVWPSKEDAIHEMIASPVWGQPTLQTKDDIPRIPEVSVTNKDGQRLIELAKKGKTIVKMSTEVSNKIKRLSLPVAEIKGKTDKYIMVCGHIDSWHVGITDNAVGNALCLELARLFKPYEGKLERGIKILWWPGHSTGRYTGSAWYADNFFEDIDENCVLMVNNDSPGVKDGDITLLRTTLSEPEGFFQEVVKEVTGKDAKWDYPMRAGDYSFWGAGIPQQMMVRDLPVPKEDAAVVGGSGGGWWWHTEYDTYDKFDMDYLVRDLSINIGIVGKWINEKKLPIDLLELNKNIVRITKEIDMNSHDKFKFDKIYKIAEKFEEAVKEFEASDLDYKIRNDVVSEVAANLVRIMFSTGSRFYHDPACAQGPLPGLSRVKGSKDAEELELLFLLTDFVRQTNRLVYGFKESIRLMNLITKSYK